MRGRVCSILPSVSPSFPTLVVLCTSRDRAAAESLELVLLAAAIPCRVIRDAEGWQLAVAEHDVAPALKQLEGYERENSANLPPPAPPLRYGPTTAGLGLAVFLSLCFLVTGPASRVSAWHVFGAVHSTAIRDGELWRVVTALTLHSDVSHVFANVVAAAVFGTLLFRSLGPGLGSSVVLAAGALGNLLNAWAHGDGHHSVGASTAVFGAIGILCGLQCVRRWRISVGGRGAWLPLAAGLGLLAMLGSSGEDTDVGAHFFGLVSGVALGGGAALLLSRPPARAWQLMLLTFASATLAAAWARAFGH